MTKTYYAGSHLGKWRLPSLCNKHWASTIENLDLHINTNTSTYHTTFVHQNCHEITYAPGLQWVLLLLKDSRVLIYSTVVFYIFVFCFVYLYISISRETQDTKVRESLTWILPHHIYVTKMNIWILCEQRFVHLRNQPDRESNTDRWRGRQAS